MSNAVKMKKKRSLSRKPCSSSRRSGLNVDMNKPEIDAIFSNFESGEIADAPSALGKVYALAIDAVARALVDGLSSVCAGMLQSAQSPEFLQDNPLAPWIQAYIPRGEVSLEGIREALSEKIDATKAKLLASLEQSLSSQALTGAMDGDLNDVLKCEFAYTRKPVHALSEARIEELLSQMRAQKTSGRGPKTYRITQSPHQFHFNFGTSAANPPLEGDSKDGTDVADRTDAAVLPLGESSDTTGISEGGDGARLNGREGFANCQALSNSLNNAEGGLEIAENLHHPQEFCLESQENRLGQILSEGLSSVDLGLGRVGERLADGARRLTSVHRGVTDGLDGVSSDIAGILQNFALQITDAVVSAYVEENPERHFLLSQILHDDPRMKDDAELSAFIAELESGDACCEEGNCELEEVTLDNDSLSHAFAQLLSDPEFSSD